MRLSSLRETKEEKFAYDPVVKRTWSELLTKAQKLYDITFDSENDDDVGSIRTISFITGPDKLIDKVRVRCQMRFAGGDWQASTAYFRCQLLDGDVCWNSKNLSQFDETSLFVVIPGKNDGNVHLQKGKHGWAPCDADDKSDRPDERKCWAFLEKHLRQLAKNRCDEY